MTAINPATTVRPRSFPSKALVIAAVELVLISMLLRWSNSPAFFAAAIVCSLGAIQLGAVLIARFRTDTRKVRRVAQAAEYSTQAVMITDPRGRIKWCNSRFTDLTGFHLDDAAGKTFSMLLHGQLTDTRTVESIRRQLRNRQPFSVELLQYNRAGQEFWVASKADPFFDSRGELTHYVVTQSALSEQRQQAREIEQLAAVAAVDQTADLQPKLAAHPTNDPALRLAQQLASLSSTDDRAQLQALVNGIKSRVEDCTASLPVTSSLESVTAGTNE